MSSAKRELGRASGLTFPIGAASELWIRLSSIALVVVMTYGYGSYVLLYYVSPKPFLVLLAIPLAPAVALAPRGFSRNVRLPVPTVLFLLWWLYSWTWSSFRPAFTGRTMDVMAMVLVVTLLAQVMPIAYFLRSLVHAGYVSMLLIAVSFVVQPSIAYGGSTSFGAYALPGLRGGFVHKNYMAVALLFTLILVLCFEKRRSVRQGLVIIVTVLTMLSQSSTGLIALLVLLALYWILGTYPEATQLLGRGFTVISLALSALGIFALTMLYGSIVGLFNKDTSLSGRTLLWDAVFKAIADRPITGYGWGGTFTNLAEEPTLSIVWAIGYPAFHSHNVALELMIRLGAVGLMLYIWLFLAAMRTGWKLLQRGHVFGTFVLMFGALVLIFGITEADLAFGVWYGLLCAVYVIGERELNANLDEREASGRSLYRRASGIRP